MHHQPINTGFVGFGKSAKNFHLPFIQCNKRYNAYAVLERHRSEAEKIVPGIITYRNYEELLGDSKIELVVITTPNSTHAQLAIQALQAGKNVVVDKPFSVSTMEAEEMIKTAKVANRTLSVYHNRRYNSDFLTIKKLLEEQKLGNVTEYFCHFDRFRPHIQSELWREQNVPGSGILYDLGPHLIDQVCCLFGLPTHVYADLRIQRSGGTSTDYFYLLLDFKPGISVRLHAGMLVKEMGPRYLVHGDSGSFIKYGFDTQEDWLKEGKSPNHPDWGLESVSDFGILYSNIAGTDIQNTIASERGNFGQFYNNLADTLQLGNPLMEKPEHGFNTIYIIEKAIESNQLGIKMPLVGLKDCGY